MAVVEWKLSLFAALMDASFEVGPFDLGALPRILAGITGGVELNSAIRYIIDRTRWFSPRDGPGNA